MPANADFQFDVFLSHSSKDKAVVRPLAERLRQDGLKVWFDEWELPVAAFRQSAANLPTEPARDEQDDGGALPRRRCAEKIEDGLEHSRVVSLAHRMPAAKSFSGLMSSDLPNSMLSTRLFSPRP